MTSLATRSALVALLSLPSLDVRAQEPRQPSYDSALYAWQAGDYARALDQLGRLLEGADGERLLEPIALLTGELHHVRPLSLDGRAARISADGRLVTYETGSGRALTTRVVSLEGSAPRELASLRGSRAVFAPDGDRLVYLATVDAPEAEAVRAAIDSMLRAPNVDRPRLAEARSRLAAVEAREARVVVRTVATGEEQTVPTPGLQIFRATFAPDGSVLLLGAASGDVSRSDVYRATPSAPPAIVTTEPGMKSDVAAAGGTLLYQLSPTRFAVQSLASGTTRTIDGSSPSLARDGSAVVYLAKDGAVNVVNILATEGSASPVVVARTERPVANPALSPDGRRVAYQVMLREDWEIHVAGADGRGVARLTREIQHDLFPQWVSPTRLLAVMGEARHRRSYLYDVATGERRRLFHNNTVRTVAQEYEWAVSATGSAVVIVADRDGDTVSPERGVYAVDLRRRVTRAEVLARVRAMRAAELALRADGRRLFAATAAAVRDAVRDVSVDRIYGYAHALFSFDSKFITQPGNARAIDYLAATLRAFGYEPELQWFEPRPGIRSANVVVTIRGSVNPELVYVAGSHFDSVEPGPGADDNSSGTTALLEVARVLANRPQPATIKLVWFTGEEAGLLGSREFARRALAAGERVVGALNNDMIGYANDQRMDNTIRFSNYGIRDLQHAAAFLFTDLITYDSRYYQNTDAHALFDAFGDVLGGIGSYPILGNPHYHQPHDVLETINQRLVAEVAKTTIASLMRLATGPAPVRALTVSPAGRSLAVSWTPSPERGVRSYVVSYGLPGTAPPRTVTVREPRATLPALPSGTEIRVKAVDSAGNESWDWSRTVVR